MLPRILALFKNVPAHALAANLILQRTNKSLGFLFNHQNRQTYTFHDCKSE